MTCQLYIGRAGAGGMLHVSVSGGGPSCAAAVVTALSVPPSVGQWLHTTVEVRQFELLRLTELTKVPAPLAGCGPPTPCVDGPGRTRNPVATQTPGDRQHCLTAATYLLHVWRG